MPKQIRYFFPKAAFLVLFCVCYFSVGYLAMAASDSVNVRQQVGEEGNGTDPSGGNGGGGIILPIDATPPSVLDLKIYDIGLRGARVSFSTDEICLSEIYFGKDRSYSSGTVPGHQDSYEIYHNFFLEELDPGTKYYLKIRIRNQRGVENIVTSHYFYTIPEFSKIMPNVGSLKATQEDAGVRLGWKNPGSSDFQGVQINRRTDSPALHPDEGEKLFLGFADDFFDINVRDKARYYYTVFAFDASNNFSSGAAVSIFVDFPGGGGQGPGGGVQPPGKTEVAIKDVRNLKAVPDVAGKKIVLSWQYAEIGEASEVEIRRDANFPPMSPLEGDMVYSGGGVFFEDRNVKKGQIYFYTVYAKSKEGVYSKGVVIASELKDSAAEVSPSEEWKDLSFVDVKSGLLLSPGAGGALRLLQDSVTGASYGVGKLPANLKAVAIQIGDAYYFLDYDEKQKSFRASFMAPETPGIYPFDIIFLNDGNEVFFEKNMKIEVLPRGKVYVMQQQSLFGGISVEKILCEFGGLIGREGRGCFYEKAVEGAELKIFKRNSDGVWEIWNAKEFNQNNPLFSNDRGEYEAYLPNGEYEIVISKEGFYSEKLQVSIVDNILNEDIRIYMKKDSIYVIIIIAILILIAGRIIKKMFLKRNKKSDDLKRKENIKRNG